jgi:type 2 lantibiotic biosynthesis protein LanM
MLEWHKALSLRENPRRGIARFSNRRGAEALIALAPEVAVPRLLKRRLAHFRIDGHAARQFYVQERPLLKPAWAEELEAMYATCLPDSEVDSWLATLGPPDDLVWLCAPIVRSAWRVVQSQLEDAWSVLGTSTQAAALLLPWLCSELVHESRQTLAVELAQRREAGLLRGETSIERYRDFISQLRDPSVAIRILSRYPVLARVLFERARQWAVHVVEMLGRLKADRAELAARLGLSPSVALKRIVPSAGEPRCGNRSVCLLEFDDGHQLMYKPRPMQIDVHFAELLEWLRNRDAICDLETAAVVVRGSYGWMEYVRNEPCGDAAEVALFYRRTGQFLALLYALESADFHYQNLVAHGGHPILVDLETLFTPGIDGSISPHLDQERYSIRHIGFLPYRAWRDGNGQGVDLSAFVGPEGAPFAVPVLRMVGAGTDEMHFENMLDHWDHGRHRPIGPDGTKPSPVEHLDEVVSGFRLMYATLERNKDVLCSDGGPLDRFRSDQIRVILQGTSLYGVLRKTATHPYYLEDAIRRDCLFDRVHFAEQRFASASSLCEDARDAIERGDFPYNCAQVGDHTLHSERTAYPKFFSRTALERARRRVASLSAEDCAAQVAIIRDAFAAA